MLKTKREPRRICYEYHLCIKKIDHPFTPMKEHPYNWTGDTVSDIGISWHVCLLRII